MMRFLFGPRGPLEGDSTHTSFLKFAPRLDGLENESNRRGRAPIRQSDYCNPFGKAQVDRQDSSRLTAMQYRTNILSIHGNCDSLQGGLRVAGFCRH